jgi:hypothetical protein
MERHVSTQVGKGVIVFGVRRGCKVGSMAPFSLSGSRTTHASTIMQHNTQNGQLKVRVEGANTPSLSSNILDWTPANADMDDLEVQGHHA